MKGNSTKKALLMSVLSLVLCFTMLLGTTFAWFTDSVTSSGNKIMSGNLKVDLEVMDKAGNWTSLKNDPKPIYNYTLWEPGYTDVKILKVAKENRLRQASEVTNYCKAGGACGSCLGEIQRIIDDMWLLEGLKKC